MYLSPDTIEKYKKGYKRASTILKEYLPDSNTATEKIERLKAIAAGKEPETISADEPYNKTDFTKINNFQWYTIRQCNLLITHRVAEEKRTPPAGTIQTGQANKPNGLPYARIYTSPKTGRNYVVKTGY